MSALGMLDDVTIEKMWPDLSRLVLETHRKEHSGRLACA
jgi:hypothetical protein